MPLSIAERADADGLEPHTQHFNALQAAWRRHCSRGPASSLLTVTIAHAAHTHGDAHTHVCGRTPHQDRAAHTPPLPRSSPLASGERTGPTPGSRAFHRGTSIMRNHPPP